MGHEVDNLPSNGSDKKKKKKVGLYKERTDRDGEREGENDKANVVKCQRLTNWDERFIAVLCTRLATFFLKFAMINRIKFQKSVSRQ